MKYIRFTFLFGFVFLIFSVPITTAIESDGIIFFPTFSQESNAQSEGWFFYTLKPGSRFVDFATIANVGESSVSLIFYPVDAISTKDGIFTLAGRTDKTVDLGSWVRIGSQPIDMHGYSLNEKKLLAVKEEDSTPRLFPEALESNNIVFQPAGSALTVIIPPKEKRIIPFEVLIPETAESGDHAGGIVAERADRETQGNFSVVKRVGIRMYGDTPGERKEDFAVLNSDINRTFLSMRSSAELINIGNVRLEPNLEIITRNIFSGGQKKYGLEEGRVLLPDNSADLSLKWEKEGFGIYFFSADAVVKTVPNFSVEPDGNFKSANPKEKRQMISSGYYISVKLTILSMAAAVLLFFISIILLKRKRKKFKKRAVKKKSGN